MEILFQHFGLVSVFICQKEVATSAEFRSSCHCTNQEDPGPSSPSMLGKKKREECWRNGARLGSEDEQQTKTSLLTGRMGLVCEQ